MGSFTHKISFRLWINEDPKDGSDLDKLRTNPVEYHGLWNCEPWWHYENLLGTNISPRHCWRWCSFSTGGIWILSREGISYSFCCWYVSDVSSMNFLGGETSNIFSCSSLKLGEWSNLTIIFFRWGGSTTQLVLQCFFWGKVDPPKAWAESERVRMPRVRIRSESSRRSGDDPPMVTPLKTNMSPENQWLEDVFPTKIVSFQGTC